MLSIYCPNPDCAKPNFYTLNKPVFCGFCGQSLTIQANATSLQVLEDEEDKTTLIERTSKLKKQKIRDKRKIRIVEKEQSEIEDDDSEIVEIPDISNLKCEIVSAGQNKLTFKDLAGQKKTGLGKRAPEPERTREEVIREFQKEARADRTPIEVDKDSD